MDFNDFYNTFYSKYFYEIHFYCMKKKLSYHDAEECTQDVFLTFFRKRNEINFDDNTKGWLYATADVIMKHYKSKNKMNYSIDSIEEVPENALAFYPFDITNTEMELKEILSILKPGDRKLITGYYIYGKTTAEFSEELGISVDSFHQRLNRARKRLADGLNKEFVDETHKTEVKV